METAKTGMSILERAMVAAPNINYERRTDFFLEQVGSEIHATVGQYWYHTNPSPSHPSEHFQYFYWLHYRYCGDVAMIMTQKPIAALKVGSLWNTSCMHCGLGRPHRVCCRQLLQAKGERRLGGRMALFAFHFSLFTLIRTEHNTYSTVTVLVLVLYLWRSTILPTTTLYFYACTAHSGSKQKLQKDDDARLITVLVLVLYAKKSKTTCSRRPML